METNNNWGWNAVDIMLSLNPRMDNPTKKPLNPETNLDQNKQDPTRSEPNIKDPSKVDQPSKKEPSKTDQPNPFEF